MRTTEDNFERVMKRTSQLKARDRARRGRWLDGSLAAAGLILTVGLGLWVSHLSAAVGVDYDPALDGAASLLSGSGALGYIVTALLAFALGVSLTVLLYRLRRRRKKDDNDLL